MTDMKRESIYEAWERWRASAPLEYTIQITFSDRHSAELAAEWLRRRWAGAIQRGCDVFVRPANIRMAHDAMLAVGRTGQVRVHPITYFPP